MKVFRYIFLGLCFFLFSCSAKDSDLVFKEFTHYPNDLKVNKNKSVFNYYLIENSPKDNNEILYFTEKFIKENVNFELNNNIKSVVVLFFDSKKSFLFFGGVDESYLSSSSTVEDRNNPRRIEYMYQLLSDNKIKLTITLYEKEKAIIPKVEYIDSQILN